MTNIASSVFDAHASDYDAARRRLVPCFDAFYGSAVAALSLLGREPRRILDLGAGTGGLSVLVAAAHPAAELLLLDGSAGMLELAADRLGGRAELRLGDLRDPLPAGRFDAVVSALAIHHLEDADKRDLLARVLPALAPGGVFVNAEQVAGATPWLAERDRAWHRDASTALGTSAAEWQAAEQRMELDRLATMDAQLGWLRAAGFADVDCLFKDHGFAVLFGRASG